MPDGQLKVTFDDDSEASVHPWLKLKESGLLWLINRTVFHPRGLALGMAYRDDGDVLGWVLLGDGSQPIQFPPDDEPELFAQAQATLAAACRKDADADA
ncbi:hypothetical protein ABZT17_26920 [Streptomyces sp. NPDC005648]|uniref:hypothetical protein n=1 Tax=Streptomyces sp. NPDC005648 TaxID=3157044 RepID=UPI0033A86238